MLKKLMMLLTVFALVFTVIGCGERTDDNGDNGEPGDTILPILTVNPESVVLEYGAPYDLMTGVSALDNIDGNITAQVQVDDGGFDSSIPATYTITYTVSDSSDNTVTKNRTITVNEPRPTIEIEGEFYPLAVNPQLKFRDNVHANVFPQGYAVAFDADYYDWLIQNQSRRTLARWSIVIIIDEDGNVLQSRDFFTNETNVNAESSRVGTDWCTGTPTGANNQWCMLFGMLANLDIPEGGFAVVFPNDGVNDEGTPRFFGAQFYAVPGENPEERLGKSATLHNIPASSAFDPDNTWPSIRIADELIATQLDIGDAFGDLLEGVTAEDEQDGALDVNITRIWYYGVVDDATVAIDVDIEDMVNDVERVYYVRYEAENNAGIKDVMHRTFQLIQPVDVDAEIIGTVMLNGQSFTAIYNFTNFAYEYNVHEGQAYVLTREFLIAQRDAYEAAEEADFHIRFSAIAVTDRYGHVIAYRHVLAREISENFPFPGSTDPGWTNNAQMTGLLELVPEDGYIIVFPNSPDNTAGSARFTGVSWLYHEDGNLHAEPGINPLTLRLNWSFPGVEYQEIVGEVAIDDATYPAVFNFSHFTIPNLAGAYDPVVHVLSREYLAQQIELYRQSTISEEHPDGLMLIIQFSMLAVTDSDGQVVHIRFVTGGEISTGETEVNTEHAWVNNNQLFNILDEIPEDGYLVIFLNSTPYRAEGVAHLWNDTPGVGLWDTPYIVDGLGKTLTFGTVEEAGELVGTIHLGEESYTVIYNFSQFAFEYNLYETQAYILTKDFLEAQKALFEEVEERDFHIRFSAIAVTDSEGNIIAYRHVLAREISENFPFPGSTEPGWTNDAQMTGLLDLVPEDGYIIVFPNSPDNTAGSARFTGVSWLYRADGSLHGEPDINPLELQLTWLFSESE